MSSSADPRQRDVWMLHLLPSVRNCHYVEVQALQPLLSVVAPLLMTRGSGTLDNVPNISSGDRYSLLCVRGTLPLVTRLVI